VNATELPSCDAIVGVEVDKLRQTFSAFLIERGWAKLLGKQRGGEQTLLEHSLAVFDTLVACLPFLAGDIFPKLSPDEGQSLLLAAVTHDAGKADSAFQAYLRGDSVSFAEHVEPEAIRTLAAGLMEASSLDLHGSIDDIVSSAVLHDRRLRRGPGELRELARDHVSPRWRKLADAVDKADSAASAGDAPAAARVLRLPETRILTGGNPVGVYQVRLRGVATTFLHEAATRAFENRGWNPVLFHAEGTVFLGIGSGPPSVEDVCAELRALVEGVFRDRAQQLAALAVGSPVGNLLPYPGFVRVDNLPALFEVVTSRREKPELKADKVAAYRKKWGEIALNLPSELETPAEPSAADTEALRVVDAEALAFKLFKNVVDRVVPGDRHQALGQRFTETFGRGSFERVMGQSTLMAVQDYLTLVRPWHQLPASQFVVGAGRDARVGDLPSGRRRELAAIALSGLVRDVLTTPGKDRPALPSDAIVALWTTNLVGDLVLEGAPPSREAVADALDGYTSIKARGSHPVQCVHCAVFIRIGEDEEPSEALGTQTSFSNRGLAFGPKASPPACRTCTTDLSLGQLLLGGRPETVIALVPRRSLGPQGALQLAGHVRLLRTALDRQLSPVTKDLDQYVALSDPGSIVRAAALSEVLLRDRGDSRKRVAKDLATALDEVLETDDLDEIGNKVGVSPFDSKTLAGMLLGGSVPPEIRERPGVARAISSSAKESLVDFALPTPNLVVVSLDRPLGGRDVKDVDRALYSFALATLFALELDVAALVAPLSELRSGMTSRSAGTVYVPANGPARSLLGGDWLSLDDARRWLRAIQAAGALIERAGANSLYEVMRYPNAGFLVRRLEQNAGDQGVWWPDLWPRIEAMKEVLG
jgi:hypothetical protein